MNIKKAYGHVVVDPKTGIPLAPGTKYRLRDVSEVSGGEHVQSPKDVVRQVPDVPKQDNVDLTRWLLSGVAGVAGHQLTSALLDDVIDDEKKKTSTWRKLLATLLPIGVGGLGALGTYALADRLGKKAAADAPNKPEGPVKDPEPSDGVDLGSDKYDGTPWGRWAGAGAAGAGSAYLGGSALRDLFRSYIMPKQVAPGAVEQALIDNRLGAIAREVSEANAGNVSLVGKNPAIAQSAEDAIIDLNTKLPHATPKDMGKINDAILRNQQLYKEYATGGAVPKDVSPLLDEADALRIRKMTPVNAAKATGWNGFEAPTAKVTPGAPARVAPKGGWVRWARPAGKMLGAAALGLTAKDILDSVHEYNANQEKMNALRDKYEEYQKLLKQQGAQ